MVETIERLNTLNRQLGVLLSEHHALQYRWSRAAIDANTWPDMRHATEPFISLQRDFKHQADGVTRTIRRRVSRRLNRRLEERVPTPQQHD
jgi:hypothetical protein